MSIVSRMLTDQHEKMTNQFRVMLPDIAAFLDNEYQKGDFGTA
jgi:hypothetical protein